MGSITNHPAGVFIFNTLAGYDPIACSSITFSCELTGHLFSFAHWATLLDKLCKRFRHCLWATADTLTAACFPMTMTSNLYFMSQTANFKSSTAKRPCKTRRNPGEHGLAAERILCI